MIKQYTTKKSVKAIQWNGDNIEEVNQIAEAFLCNKKGKRFHCSNPECELLVVISYKTDSCIVSHFAEIGDYILENNMTLYKETDSDCPITVNEDRFLEYFKELTNPNDKESKIKLGKLTIREEANHKGEKYINLSNEGEVMGLNKKEEKELEDLLKEFLYKHF